MLIDWDIYFVVTGNVAVVTTLDVLEIIPQACYSLLFIITKYFDLKHKCLGENVVEPTFFIQNKKSKTTALNLTNKSPE